MAMLPFLVAGLTAMAILLIAVGISMSGGAGAVGSRLERYASSQSGSGSSAGDDRGSVVVAGLSRVMERQDRGAKLGVELARADLKLRPAEFALAWFASPFLFTGAAFLLSVIFPALRNPVALAVAAAIGAYFPRFYLKRRQGQRLRAFATQLPDTITLLANSLRAGSSFLQGVELVTREGRPPISEEFERVVREMQLGMALQPALDNLARRMTSEDLDLVVTAISIQSQVGGNLATVLDAIAHTIRERVRLIGEINTLTAMQRYSGYVITALPVCLGLLLLVISPTYMAPMFERPPEAFGLPLGVIFFLVGLFMMGMGYFFIRRIVDIKV